MFIALFITDCTKDGTYIIRNEALIQELKSEISSDSLESYVRWLENMGTRFALADNRREVAVRIKNKFITFGYTDVKLDSFWLERTYRQVLYQQWQYNVVATLAPGNPSDSVSIMCGHYDNILSTGDPFSVVPGANDNASGVAATLEIARVFKKNNFIPSDTIKFIAFAAEELGLHGSKHFASDAAGSFKNIKLVLNSDMIAYETGSDKSGWRINIMDYDNSHSLRHDAEILCGHFTSLTPYNDNLHNAQSDSYPFYLNGYKAIFFFADDIDPSYHTLNDLTDNCNFEYCREAAIISCAVLVNKN